MSATLLLLPRLDRLLAALPDAPIWQWLGRADRVADADASVNAAARAAFDIAPVDFSHAAVARYGECGDVGLDAWLRVDPCWLQPDMNSLRMMAWGQLQLSAEDAEDLAGVLRPLFGDAGFELSMPHPDRWYLKLSPGSDPPRFSHPLDVLGDDVERHLPTGTSGLHWKRLLNEAQMILHQHAVSRRREAKGLAPINSVWFWGGGRVPNRVRAAHASYFSGDEIVAGLARQAGVPCQPVPSSLQSIKSLESAAIDLRRIEPAALNADWLEPAIARLRAGDSTELRFAFAAGERFHLRRGQRWRFWRKPLRLSVAVVAGGQV